MTMKTFTLKRAWAVAFLLTALPSVAHDFSATTPSGQKLYFNITDVSKKHVEVTYKGSITLSDTSSYKGSLSIPSQVKHKDVTYRVTGISPKAFSGAGSLTDVVLPLGLQYIGDFAFEGCTSLTGIVFPGNAIRMGEGVFFKCTSISNVSLGGDWTEVNLKIFRWSDSLRTVQIPAKVTQLRNLKSLKSLRTIEVDANNSRFASADGMLYNKDMSTLLGVPRGRTGKVRIPEGVVAVRWGALIDCPEVTSVDLPSTLRSLSFREFSRMKQLQQLILRAESPLLTAADATGKKLFLLNVDTDVEKFKLIVPKTASKSYKAALVSIDGAYCELSENTPEGISPELALLPFEVKSGETVKATAVQGVKSFAKYE